MIIIRLKTTKIRRYLIKIVQNELKPKKKTIQKVEKKISN